MTAWISRFDTTPRGRLRVAVKDAIDIAGTVTTAGCVAVRRAASPAQADAACLAGIRADPGAVIVGKSNLAELCISGYGDNAVFGTPVNPIAPDLIPGGSSSGSAVAVASGEADIGLGTDTGGSVRIPAACCGIVGLKTTLGRISTAGVLPLAPSLDTIGPLARTVGDAVRGMGLLVPGWSVAPRPAKTVGRLRIEGVDERTEEMVDAALENAGLTVREVRLPGWEAAWSAFITILLGELWQSHRELLDADGVGAYVNDGIRAGQGVTAARLAKAMGIREDWRAELAAALAETGLLALPTLPGPPPPLDNPHGFPITQLTAPFNLAGVPAIAMPVPSPGFPVPVSLQLVGPANGEDVICATALTIEESAPASRRGDLRSRPARR